MYSILHRIMDLTIFGWTNMIVKYRQEDPLKNKLMRQKIIFVRA